MVSTVLRFGKFKAIVKIRDGIKRIPESILYVLAALQRDFGAFAFSLLGCGISATVALFQFAVFTSFLSVSTVIPRYINASVWVGDYGVQCFDLASPIAEDEIGPLLRFFPNASYRRVYTGFTSFRATDGRRQTVNLVGVDNLGLEPAHFLADNDEINHLGISLENPDAEIANETQTFFPSKIHMSSFLGTPYILTNGRDAADAFKLAPDEVSYLAIDIPNANAKDIQNAVRQARAQSPNLMIMTGEEFTSSTALYWLIRTGGGAAILMACILATLLMLVFLVNGIGRFVQRRHNDVQTFLGLGATRQEIFNILLLTSIIFATGGVTIALVVAPILKLATHQLVPWVSLKPVDYVFAFVMALLCAVAGSIVSTIEVRKLPIAEIFRT